MHSFKTIRERMKAKARVLAARFTIKKKVVKPPKMWELAPHLQNIALCRDDDALRRNGPNYQKALELRDERRDIYYPSPRAWASAAECIPIYNPRKRAYIDGRPAPTEKRDHKRHVPVRCRTFLPSAFP